MALSTNRIKAQIVPANETARLKHQFELSHQFLNTWFLLDCDHLLYRLDLKLTVREALDFRIFDKEPGATRTVQSNIQYSQVTEVTYLYAGRSLIFVPKI